MKLHVAMLLRMQLRRIVIMVIIEYAVPSLALNYPCKEYKIIYEGVHIYLCTCRRNKYPCKSEFVWNVHIKVMLKLFLNSQHAWACWDMVARFIVFIKFPDRQSNVHFPWPNELTICPDIIGFQIPLKTSCTGHRWRKAKYFLFFCSRKICLVLFQGCRSFVLRHLCPVHKLNAQTPITTILEWMDWSYRKPYIYLSFNFWKQYPADGICLTAVNMQKYVTFLWLLFVYKAAKHRYIFLRGVGLEMKMK